VKKTKYQEFLKSHDITQEMLDSGEVVKKEINNTITFYKKIDVFSF
jgi:hypothetical protein